MPVLAKIKFPGNLPWTMEHKLITKGGFKVFSRQGQEWLIVEKRTSTWKPEVLVNGELAEDIQASLIKRCNTVVDQFHEPEIHMKSVRIRLTNISLTLPPLQRKFVQEWMIRNCKEDQ